LINCYILLYFSVRILILCTDQRNQVYKDFHLPEVCHKFRVLTVFRTSTLVLPDAQTRWLWKQDWLPYKHICKSGGKHQFNYQRRVYNQVPFTIPTLCSLQFAAVYRDDVKDVISVHTDVWSINYVALYRGLTVIYFNNISSFPILIFLSLTSLDRQNSHTFPASNLPTFLRKWRR